MNGLTIPNIAYTIPRNRVRKDALTTLGREPLVTSCRCVVGIGTLVVVALEVGAAVLSSNYGGLISIFGQHA